MISLGSVRVSGSSAEKNEVGGARRQRTRRQHGRIHAEAFGREIGQKGVVFAGRKLPIKIGQRADVARDCLRQAPRDQLPMMLHEREGDCGLQKDHRQDDDQERALVEAFRKYVRDGASAASPEVADARELTEGAEGRAVDHPSAIRR